MQIQSYLTLDVLPGSGVGSNTIFPEAVRRLRNAGIGAFALSFPEAREAEETGDVGARNNAFLGNRMQIFGSAEIIARAAEIVDIDDDYVAVSSPRAIDPEKAPSHVIVKRVRGTMRTSGKIEREIRRTERRAAEGKRKPVSTEEIGERKRTTSRSKLPFIRAASHSTGQKFAISFKLTKAASHRDGDFDSYGFSKGQATVPLIL